MEFCPIFFCYRVSRPGFHPFLKKLFQMFFVAHDQMLRRAEIVIVLYRVDDNAQMVALQLCFTRFDLFPSAFDCVGHIESLLYAASRTVAMPMPPPMHIVARASCLPSRFSSAAALPVMRAPEAPSG